MTPAGIKLGRQFDSRVTSVQVTAESVASLVGADANRVALVVALPAWQDPDIDGSVTIGPVINGVVVPLTTLSAGHPVCYLSVDKIGSALMLALSANNMVTSTVTLGVTIVRQVQELPT